MLSKWRSVCVSSHARRRALTNPITGTAGRPRRTRRRASSKRESLARLINIPEAKLQQFGRRKLWVGGLRTVGPSAVRVPGGTMPQKSRRGFPSPQAARMVTSARFHLQEPVVDSGKVGPTMPPGPGLAVGSVLGHYRRCDSLTFRLQPTRYDEASQSVGKCLWPMDPRCIACMLNAERAAGCPRFC